VDVALLVFIRLALYLVAIIQEIKNLILSVPNFSSSITAIYPSFLSSNLSCFLSNSSQILVIADLSKLDPIRVLTLSCSEPSF
jgi:hypothetical protein